MCFAFGLGFSAIVMKLVLVIGHVFSSSMSCRGVCLWQQNYVFALPRSNDEFFKFAETFGRHPAIAVPQWFLFSEGGQRHAHSVGQMMSDARFALNLFSTGDWIPDATMCAMRVFVSRLATPAKS